MKNTPIGFSDVQKLLKDKELDLRIEFGNLTKRDKDILMKTVKLQEEVGELANDILAALSLQRKSKLEKFRINNLYDEFSDVIISTLTLANSLKVDIDRAVKKKLHTVLNIYSQDK